MTATSALGGNRIVIVVCCTAIFMTTLDSTILNVALPSVQHDLHASNSGLQWAVDSYILVRASTMFVCGSISDRFGRRRMFKLGVALFALGSLACSLSPGPPELVMFRGIQGLGSAVMTPASLAILIQAMPGRVERGRAIGAWSATTGVSMVAGPVLGGLLVESLGWRSVFWVNIPISLGTLLATRLLDESRALEPRPLDLAGQLTMAGALAALTYALISGPSAGWSSGAFVALLVTSVACGAGFSVIERKVRRPMIALAHLRSVALAGGIAIAVVAFLAMGAFLFFNTLYLQEIRGLSPVQAGLMTIPATVMSSLCAPWAGRRIGSHGPRLPATMACALIAASMVMLTVVMAVSTPFWVLVLAYLLLGSGYGMVNPPATYAVVSALPADQASVAAAMTSTARQIGTNLGVALVGAVVFSSGVHLSARPGAADASGLFVAGLRHGYLVTAVLAAAVAILAAKAFSDREEIVGQPVAVSVGQRRQRRRRL